MKIDAVIIKNMTVPDSCALCPLAILNTYGERYCYAIERNVTAYATWLGGRYEECPMQYTMIEGD